MCIKQLFTYFVQYNCTCFLQFHFRKFKEETICGIYEKVKGKLWRSNQKQTGKSSTVKMNSKIPKGQTTIFQSKDRPDKTMAKKGTKDKYITHTTTPETKARITWKLTMYSVSFISYVVQCQLLTERFLLVYRIWID